jgi:Flp pilus assembly protein TadG
MPLLLMLLFGVIEFAWLFSQNLDVRHGAREGARLVAVNYPDGPQSPTPTPTDTTQSEEIVAEICSRMSTARDATITLNSPTGGVGDSAEALVSAPAYALTGFLAWAIPDDLVLTSRVEIRIEQPAGWAPVTDAPCP